MKLTTMPHGTALTFADRFAASLRAKQPYLPGPGAIIFGKLWFMLLIGNTR